MSETNTNDDSLVHFEEVKKYVLENVPIVPLSENGLPNVYDLYTPKELQQITSNLSEFEIEHVYEDPDQKRGLRLVNLLLLQDPLEFWTDEKIRRQKWYGIASLAGPSKIPSKKDPNKVLLFIQVDADEPRGITIVKRVIEKRGYLNGDRKTVVQDTPGGGLHCEFCIAVDPNNLEELELWRRRFLRTHHCKSGGRVEIKTWFSGQITLDPSKYRKDKSKFYRNTSGFKGVFEDDPIIYELLISELKNGDCLRITPEEACKIGDEEADEDAKSSNDAANVSDEDRKFNDPSDVRVKAGVDILLGKDVDENGECQFNSIYFQGYRNLTILSLGAHLFHKRIRLEFAKEIIKRMCQLAGFPGVVKKAFDTVERTYRKGYKGGKLRGKSGLIELFKIADKNGESEVRAKARLAKLNEAFGFNVNNNSPKNKSSKSSKIGSINEADIIADLARKRIPFMFINSVKQPCAIIERDGIVELMVMSDKDGNFADALRQMWRDENEANGQKMKTTIPEDRLTQARLSLISDAKRLRIEPIKTHLRVAWEVKNQIMRYDLANSQGKQVRIWGTDDGKGIEIIESTHILEEIKIFKESNYDITKIPIFFQRYHQIAQTLPSLTNFSPKILDFFINNLTNVVGKKASASYKRSVKHWGTEGGLDDDIKIHMAKVGLVSMLVPDIPHHLQNIFGPPQSIKSTYLRHQKSLIDPTTLDLFLPMRSLKDLDKILAQNYFICFDNYFEMTQELSDKICAAITGSGTQIRELFTTQTMVTLYIKACIAFSSVTRLFRQPDALSRLFNFEFLPFAEEEGYDTEDEINSRFEEIKPQILACMYSTLSKAINIRKRIYGMYKLGRMADVLEWSEAISQALDYEPGLYLKRHLALKEIQNKHSLSYDPLVYYYRKIYYDTFVKPADDSSNGKLSSTETNARQEGYIVFTYKELYSILADYAKEDEYDTRKSNTLWPRNSLDLANRTREISILILKTDKFAVEVRQTKSNTNEYVFGTIEGVEEYIQNQEKESNESNSNSSHDSDPDQDLESGQHPDQDIEKSTGVPSTSFPILQKWNTSGDPPYNAPATFDVHSSIKKDHESWKSKIGLVSGSVPNGTVEQWNTPKSGKNKRKISHIGSDCSISGCSKCSIIEKWNTHNMSMRAIAKSLGIGLATVSREIRKWNSQSVPLLKMEHPKVEHLDPKVEHSSPAFFELVPEFKNFAAFDGEWYREDLESNKNSGKAGMLYCFCLINNQGHEARLHLDEFNGHNGRFMSAILDQMQKYDALVGYAILAKKEEWMRYGINGDVEQIQLNCERVGLLERFELVKERVRFLDLHSVFSCGNVKAFLEAGENVKYRGETLDAVATAYLKEGKYGNIKGADAEFLDRKVQLDYCMQDAKLCMKLSQKDYFRVLTIFYNLSKEIGKDFFITCNYAKPTAWWRDFLKPLGYEKVTGDVLKWQEEHLRYAKDGKKKKGVYYNGGKVFEPVAGLYNGVTTYDVSSMYPTMAIVYNISSETINCDCCKDDPDARISDEVMKLINDGLVADGYQARPWHYWICKRRRGIFSNIMKMLYQKKAEYKKQGRILEEKAVKLFANSGYGTFGQVNFEFYDFRLTELVTAFARHTLIGLRDLFEHNNAQVLYGDTDSLFVNMNTTTIDITGKAKEMFHVDLDKDKVWKLLALTEKKKAYFGILDNGKHSHKILPGLKSNYPVYDNEVVSKLTSNEMLKLFLHPSAESRQKAREYVINEIVEAFHILSDRLLVRDMEYVKENLCYSEEASKALYDYEGNCWQAYLFDEILEECNNDTALAKKNSQGKRVYQYWKIANNGKSKKTATMHPERYTLSVEAYKADLWTCVKLILQVYGVPENEISRLHNKLVYNQMGLS